MVCRQNPEKVRGEGHCQRRRTGRPSFYKSGRRRRKPERLGMRPLRKQREAKRKGRAETDRSSPCIHEVRDRQSRPGHSSASPSRRDLSHVQSSTAGPREQEGARRSHRRVLPPSRRRETGSELRRPVGATATSFRWIIPDRHECCCRSRPPPIQVGHCAGTVILRFGHGRACPQSRGLDVPARCCRYRRSDGVISAPLSRSIEFAPWASVCSRERVQSERDGLA